MFRKKKFIGYTAYQKLIQNKISIQMSRLYRILNDMQEEETLNFRWENNPSGPRRKYYFVSKKGLKKLDNILFESATIVHDFYTDYILDRPNNIAEDAAKTVIANIPVDGNIIYVSKEYSRPVITQSNIIQSMLPKGSHYVISQKIDIDNIKPKNLTFLEGDYHNIPLKNNHADLVYVFNLPEKKILGQFMTEIDRLLNKKGKLVISIPTFFLDEENAPLTMQQFIEKIEHRVISKEKYFKKKDIMLLINKYFKEIKEKKFLHITYIIASQPYSIDH